VWGGLAQGGRLSRLVSDGEGTAFVPWGYAARALSEYTLISVVVQSFSEIGQPRPSYSDLTN